jgi:hypothetical protein
MTTQTKLLVYLRKLGFDIDFQPNKTVCTDGQNIIVMKRGRLGELHYHAIRVQLENQGYDVSNFDSDFLPTKAEKLNKKKTLEVLRPFIEFADERLDRNKAQNTDIDNHVVYAYNHKELTIGDFRRLQEFYNKLNK